MSYLLTFTTFKWDEFISRQFERIQSRVGSGNVCIIADETNGAIAGLPVKHVIRTSKTEIFERCGLSPFIEVKPFGEKSVFWWNLDYLTYRVMIEHPEFDYYITMDYDACINMDIDGFVEDIARRKLDFVAEPITTSNTWPWIEPHQNIYPGQKINGDLLCITVMSKAAAMYLWQRRRDMAVAYKAGTLFYWPFCEVFCAMEIRSGCFNVGSLSTFGDTSHYDFRPAYSEKAAASVTGDCFVHPVFDKERLIKALITYQHPFSDLLRANSRVRLQLEEYPAIDYIPSILGEGLKRLLAFLRRRTTTVGKQNFEKR